MELYSLHLELDLAYTHHSTILEFVGNLWRLLEGHAKHLIRPLPRLKHSRRKSMAYSATSFRSVFSGQVSSGHFSSGQFFQVRSVQVISGVVKTCEIQVLNFGSFTCSSKRLMIREKGSFIHNVQTRWEGADAP
jgi:hypothetical protein